MAADSETTTAPKRNKYLNSLQIQGIVKSDFVATESA
jgi:hypothetical protein